MLCRVRRIALLVLVVGLALQAAADDGDEQRVTPVTPAAEQRVEALPPAGEQRVEAVDAGGIQQVTGGTKGPLRRGLETTGKVVLGVLAAVISLGVMAASLIFL